MFDDFSPDSSQQQTRKRLGSSAALALVVYVGGGLLLVSATNKARQLVKDSLTQVAFAPPPPPPEPEVAPPPEEAAKPRAKAKRAELKTPDKVPLQKLKESDKPLIAAGPTGPVDGFLDGVEGGTGNAPKPVEKLIPSKDLPGNQFPPYPRNAQKRGIFGTVVVAFDVLPDGKVANPKIVEGPEELHDTVLKTAMSWRFQPATQGGKPVLHRRTKTIKFNLEDA
jgi:TonB family protein